MRDIPRAELARLTPSVLLALLRVDSWPSDYAGSLTQATLERIHVIAQEDEDQADEGDGCSAGQSRRPVVFLPRVCG